MNFITIAHSKKIEKSETNLYCKNLENIETLRLIFGLAQTGTNMHKHAETRVDTQQKRRAITEDGDCDAGEDYD